MKLMKIALPPGEDKIEIPEEWRRLNTPENLIHHLMWKSESQPGDICFGIELQPADVVQFILDHTLKKFVQFNSPWFKEDIEMSLRMSGSPTTYFSDPVRSVLNSSEKNDCHRGEWSFTDGTQKQNILDQVYGLLPNPSQVLKESVRAVFEELYMNAILDAPRESIRAGKEKYGYEKMTPAKISLGFDDSRLALACTDPYGTLEIHRFLSRMNEVYKRGAGQVVNLVREKGGAGLGCVILFEHSSALFLGVTLGKMTTVTSQIPLNLNHRQRASIHKSLHILE